MYKKLNLSELVLLIDEPNRSCCHALLEDHGEIIQRAPGSLIKHQAWPGGYKDHLEQMMNWGIKTYRDMQQEYHLPFSISDFILVQFLHDIEKPFKYIGGNTSLKNEEEKWKFLQHIVEHYRFTLTDEHWNGLKYIHGEGEAYNPAFRVQTELAAFCHICDVVSARILYAHPKH